MIIDNHVYIPRWKTMILRWRGEKSKEADIAKYSRFTIWSMSGLASVLPWWLQCWCMKNIAEIPSWDNIPLKWFTPFSEVDWSSWKLLLPLCNDGPRYEDSTPISGPAGRVWKKFHFSLCFNTILPTKVGSQATNQSSLLIWTFLVNNTVT